MIVSRVWGSPTPETLHDYVGIPVASLSFGDGSRLRARLSEAGGTLPARLSTRVESRWTEIPVITAEIRGADEDFVMVTGHVDSWGLGALDNASGNACAVELARILAPLASDMRRSVRFVLWSGHSHGRYAGSTAWCDAHFEELERHCLLNVNSDCLGGRGATVMTGVARHGLDARPRAHGAARGGRRHGLARLPFFAQLRPKLLGRRRALDLLSGLRAAAL